MSTSSKRENDQERASQCVAVLSEVDASLVWLAQMEQVERSGDWKRGRRAVHKIVYVTDDRVISIEVPLHGQFVDVHCFCKADIVQLHREGYPVADVMESTTLAITPAPKHLSKNTGHHSIIHARIFAAGLNHRVFWHVLNSSTECAELLELGTDADIPNENETPAKRSA